jgi:hypothetical protein
MSAPTLATSTSPTGQNRPRRHGHTWARRDAARITRIAEARAVTAASIIRAIRNARTGEKANAAARDPRRVRIYLETRSPSQDRGL